MLAEEYPDAAVGFGGGFLQQVDVGPHSCDHGMIGPASSLLKYNNTRPAPFGLAPPSACRRKSKLPLYKTIVTILNQLLVKSHFLNFVAFSTFVLSTLATSVDAAIVAVGTSNANLDAYSSEILTNDLLTGLSPAVTGNMQFDTDGVYDGVYVSASSAPTGGNSYMNPYPIVMTFDLTGSVTGYDLTSITSIAGWNANRNIHASQNYTVSVSFIGDSAYIPLTLTGAFDVVSGGSIVYYPFTSAGSGASKVTITENSGGVIASGVDGIRFNFMVDSVFQEIDVLGVASAAAIPEPSAAALLLGFGATALVIMRRHRL